MKRRAGPAATATLIASVIGVPAGVLTVAKGRMAACIARAQATPRAPLSPANQQVIESPANPITLPPYR